MSRKQTAWFYAKKSKARQRVDEELAKGAVRAEVLQCADGRFLVVVKRSKKKEN